MQDYQNYEKSKLNRFHEIERCNANICTLIMIIMMMYVQVPSTNVRNVNVKSFHLIHSTYPNWLITIFVMVPNWNICWDETINFLIISIASIPAECIEQVVIGFKSFSCQHSTDFYDQMYFVQRLRYFCWS